MHPSAARASSAAWKAATPPHGRYVAPNLSQSAARAPCPRRTVPSAVHHTPCSSATDQASKHVNIRCWSPSNSSSSIVVLVTPPLQASQLQPQKLVSHCTSRHALSCHPIIGQDLSPPREYRWKSPNTSHPREWYSQDQATSTGCRTPASPSNTRKPTDRTPTPPLLPQAGDLNTCLTVLESRTGTPSFPYTAAAQCTAARILASIAPRSASLTQMHGTS